MTALVILSALAYLAVGWIGVWFDAYMMEGDDQLDLGGLFLFCWPFILLGTAFAGLYWTLAVWPYKHIKRKAECRTKTQK